jgi:N-acetylmuramoyl-L-alanine amidase
VPLVVVDPGHGGRDPGASGNGYQEKNLVLRAALLLRDALQRCSIRVIMTRETDTLPLPGGTIAEDLSYRARIANQAGADLFISWHADAVSDPSVNGAAAWIHPSTRGTRTDTWGQMLVDAITASTGQKNRGVYLGDFAVLRETSMDAVLIESGFITNPQEADRLADPAVQHRLAEGAARGVCAIFDLPYVAPAQPAPTPTPSPPTPPPVSNEPETLPAWAEASIRQVIDWGIMQGDPDGRWRPNQPVTRAEMAVVITRLFDFMQRGGTPG